ncbi:Spy/CpxP family protein refolding chaperone [Ferruginibacter profundus]
MSTQTKSKLYLLIIGILLVTNIGMLFFFLNNKRDDHGKQPPRIDRRMMMKNFLQNDVGFNEQQLQQYDTLSNQFRERNKADMDTLKANKEEQMKELGSKGFSVAAIDSIVSKSAENQKLMELHLLNHFANIRKLCTAEQLVKFDTTFYKIWSRKKKPEDKKTDERK